MPIEITIQKTFVLDDVWCNKEEWAISYEGNLPAVLDLLDEDRIAVLDEAGGLAGIVTAARWIDR